MEQKSVHNNNFEICQDGKTENEHGNLHMQNSVTNLESFSGIVQRTDDNDHNDEKNESLQQLQKAYKQILKNQVLLQEIDIFAKIKFPAQQTTSQYPELPRRGDFEGDIFPVGFGETSGMLLGPRNFSNSNSPSGTFPYSGAGKMIQRFDPLGPFGGVGGDPDNDIFRPPGGSGVPKRGGPSII